MSSEKPPKSDRFQIMTAVLLMGLFAAIFIIAGLPKGNITSFACSYVGDYVGFAGMCSDLKLSVGSDQPIVSKINSVCLDEQGLKISAVFDEPLTGVADIQVFSTGDDYFPSEQGLADSFKISMTIPTAVDHLDLVIPVDAMPVGIQIFGNIFVSEEGVSSHLSYFLNVIDCSRIGALPSQLIPMDSPIIHSATCLPSRQLMIAFEFEESVPGQYQVLVADTPYELASVINQPAILFFSGDPPPAGPIIIKLTSATDQEIIFEETYTPPICGLSQ